MFKKLKLSIVGGLLFASLAGGVVGATVPSGQAGAACGDGFLGIPAWYKGITNADCSVKSPDRSEDGLRTYIWTIALNVIEIVLRVVAYLAVFFIIYGGFLYLTSSGSSDATARALKTIINASVGFAIALSAVAVKDFVWKLVVPATNEFGVPVQANAGAIIVAGLNMAYFIAGALAVVMIITAGLTYVTSSGDSAKVAKAKNTILYSIIGIAVIIFAFAVTTFINSRL